MNKKVFALFCALAMLIAAIPCTYADTFVNQAFVGTYLSAGATESNYGMLNILSCDENSISVDFKFIKNDNQQLIYTFSPGTMSDNKGLVRFTVKYADGRFVSNGTMKLTLDAWCVKISCDSDQGQHLFDGTMKPQFDLKPYELPSGSNTTTTTPNITMNPGVSVVLNSQKVNFSDDVHPIIINDSTYVPLRSMFDSMGINVYWDQFKKSDILNAQSITCTKNDTIVQFMRTFNDSGSNVWTLTKWVGENTDSSKFTRINIADLQPTIIGEYSYIPLRVVSEAFGAYVGWDDSTRTVTIDCDTSNSFKYDKELIGKIEDFSQDIATGYITDDFSEVVSNPTPYFSPQAKFYKYNAVDRWGNVVLNVIYGGYIDVFPVEADESAEEIDVNPDVTDETESNKIIEESDTNESIVTETESEYVDDGIG